MWKKYSLVGYKQAEVTISNGQQLFEVMLGLGVCW